MREELHYNGPYDMKKLNGFWIGFAAGSFFVWFFLGVIA